MTTIRSLFDTSRNIDRHIKKVITYGDSQESLRTEISEYIVTASIEEQFRLILDRMQYALEAGGQNDVGVWVSGFYGSGKSSFTKYLGLAFDQDIKIDGVPFMKHLQDRLHTSPVKALLATVTQRYPAAVVMLDLASEMLTNATMEDVSTVLYYKVLQWAGYSRNLKVAALERRVEVDGRTDEFLALVKARMPDKPWASLQNDPLIVDWLLPSIASEMYPALFPTPSAFSTSTEDFVTFQNDRVREMIDIVRRKSGKQYVVFVIDEVGNYVASRSNLILNLDGLAKNIKAIGEGKVWIIATAQQTLTEDNPRAALNSPELFKLADRFPIKVDLESKDIKEICYLRLLAKSSAGQQLLEKLFDDHGQELRHNTKLQDARYYDADFAKSDFVHLYPFLPAHFDILLHLLGALARTTGGIGLRSAIKIVQDILIEQHLGSSAVADQPVGWLATTVTLYNALEKDIKRAFTQWYQAVEKTPIAFPDSPLHYDVSKTVAVLQILGNIPITPQNIASLMHPSVTSPSLQDDVRKVIAELVKDAVVPLAEKDGAVYFLSERLRDVENERGAFVPRTVDMRRIVNDAIRECFNPLPRCTLEGTMTVTSGLKVRGAGMVSSLAGEQEIVQTVVEIVDPSMYDEERAHLLEESRSNSNKALVALAARNDAVLEELAAEVGRCVHIAEVHRNDPDQEVRQYCNDQQDHAGKVAAKLQGAIRKVLEAGSFIFRGQQTAVAALDTDLTEAAKKLMGNAAPQVFDRYGEAPARVSTDTAEKLLRVGVGNPAAVTSVLDPLHLIETVGGMQKFRVEHKAIVSTGDYLRQTGATEGKRLLDHFSDAPFGWQADTTRYIVAAMLMAGLIRLKIAGHEITAAGPQAIDALKTNNSFKQVGVSMRDNAPPVDVLSRAASRLSTLVGDRVVPMEQEISKATVRLFSQLQRDYAPLPSRLETLKLVGVARARELCETMSNVLVTDASDATQRLGADESPLYDDLTWATHVKAALDDGLEQTIRSLQEHRRVIESLPDTGIPGDLRRDAADVVANLDELSKNEDFADRSTEFSGLTGQIERLVAASVARLLQQQTERVKRAGEELQKTPGWIELLLQDQQNALNRLDGLVTEATQDVAGLQKLLAQDYTITGTIDDLKEEIRRQDDERRLRELEEHQKSSKTKDPPQPVPAYVSVPARATTAAELESLIQRLQEIVSQASSSADVDVTFAIKQEE